MVHFLTDVYFLTDVPLKVVGIVPQKRERNLLWKLIYALYERNSIYKYGRTELNLFVSEKEYKVFMYKKLVIDKPEGIFLEPTLQNLSFANVVLIVLI